KAKTSTTTKKVTTNSPKTGVKGISAAFAVFTLAAAAAFAARSRKRDDQ
ncbi:MAG: NPXTG-anchored protein, partial [Ruminococcus sp.]|nr:NPXTG-anchored protein [Ruminococcus sp.]